MDCFKTTPGPRGGGGVRPKKKKNGVKPGSKGAKYLTNCSGACDVWFWDPPGLPGGRHPQDKKKTGVNQGPKGQKT